MAAALPEVGFGALVWSVLVVSPRLVLAWMHHFCHSFYFFHVDAPFF